MEYINEYFNYLESEHKYIFEFDEYMLLEERRLGPKYREIEDKWKVGLKFGLSILALSVIGMVFYMVYRQLTDICDDKCLKIPEGKNRSLNLINFDICKKKCYLKAIESVIPKIDKDIKTIKNMKPENDKDEKRKKKALEKLYNEKEKWTNKKIKYSSKVKEYEEKRKEKIKEIKNKGG